MTRSLRDCHLRYSQYSSTSSLGTSSVLVIDLRLLLLREALGLERLVQIIRVELVDGAEVVAVAVVVGEPQRLGALALLFRDGLPHLFQHLLHALLLLSLFCPGVVDLLVHLVQPLHEGVGLDHGRENQDVAEIRHGGLDADLVVGEIAGRPVDLRVGVLQLPGRGLLFQVQLALALREQGLREVLALELQLAAALKVVTLGLNVELTRDSPRVALHVQDGADQGVPILFQDGLAHVRLGPLLVLGDLGLRDGADQATIVVQGKGETLLGLPNLSHSSCSCSLGRCAWAQAPSSWTSRNPWGARRPGIPWRGVP